MGSLRTSKEEKFGAIACQKSKSVDPVLHPGRPGTGPGVPCAPVPKVILTVRQRDKRGRFKYCNLAFRHCLFEVFGRFVIPFPMFAV